MAKAVQARCRREAVAGGGDRACLVAALLLAAAGPALGLDTVNDRCTNGTITATGTSPNGEDGSKAFDDSTATKWHIGDASGWIAYQFGGGARYAITRYTLTSANDAPARDPRDWTLEGSLDGTHWVVVDQRTGEGPWAARNTTYGYECPGNVTAYGHYRLNISTNNGVDPWGGLKLQIAELELFGPAGVVVAITNPAAGAEFAYGATIAIRAAAGGTVVTNVDFFDGPTWLGAAGAAPYEWRWTNAGWGTHRLTATAWDEAGNVATSAVVTLRVTPPMAAWAKQMKITFAGYTGTEPLEGFPALVVLGTNLAGFAYDDFLSGTNDDLRFLASDGVTVLPHEVETWDPKGDSYVWVRLPVLAGAGEFIWANWGMAEVPALASTTNGAVWDGNYRAVWHLGGATDATTNRNTLTDASAGAAPARIGQGRSFNGTSSYMQAADSASLSLTGSFTLEAWVRGAAFSAGANQILAKDDNSAYRWRVQGGGAQLWMLLNDGPSYDASLAADHAFASNAWYHVAVRGDLAARVLHFYVNGHEVGAATTTKGAIADTAGTLNLGRVGSYGEYWNGLLDEVRISGGVRSADWVRAAYLNAASNGAFEGSFNAYGPVGWTASNVPPVVNNAGGATGITAAGATLNGLLVSTGTAETAVFVVWGPADGGTNWDQWAERYEWAGPEVAGPLALPVALATDRVWYYRFVASNAVGTTWAPGVRAFMTAPVWITADSPALEAGRVPGTFTVHRASSATGIAVTVSYGVTGGTAGNGVDYAPLPGTLTLPAGVGDAAIPVVPRSDRFTGEDDETVEVTLLAGPAYPLGTPASASLAVVNNAGMTGALALVWDNATGNGRWDQSSLNWHVAGDAYGTVFFQDGDGVTFGVGDRPGGTVSLNGATATVQGVSFKWAQGDSGFTLANGTIRLGSGGLTHNADWVTEAIAATIVLTADATIQHTGNRSLYLNGAIDTAGHRLTTAYWGQGHYYNGPITGRGRLQALYAGDLRYEADNTFSGPFVVNGGARALLRGNAGAFSATRDIRVDSEYLRLGWTDSDRADDGVGTFGRLANAATVTVTRGTLSLVGKDNTATRERIGVLRLNDGCGGLQVNAGGGTGTATLVASTLARGTGGCAIAGAWNIDYCNEQTYNLGAGSCITFADGGASLLQVGGSGSRGTDRAIVPYLVSMAAANSGRPNTFVRYDDAQGVTPLDRATEFVTAVDGSFPAVDADGNDNVRLPFTAVHPDDTPDPVVLTLPGDTTVNALYFDNDKANATGKDVTLTAAPGTTLTVKSGLIMISPTAALGQQGNVSISVPWLEFGAREGFLMGWGDWSGLRVSSAIHGTAGLTTVNGGADIRLQGDNRGLAGTIVVASGYLNVDSRYGLGNNSNAVHLASGGVLLPWAPDALTVGAVSGFGMIEAPWNSGGRRLNIGGDGGGSQGGTLSLLAGGAIRPGLNDRSGTLTLSGFADVKLLGGTLEIDMPAPGESDRLVLTKTSNGHSWPALSLAGVSLRPAPAYIPEPGELFLAVQVATNTPIVGKFVENDAVTVQVRNKLCTFDILYNSNLAGGDGNDVVLRVANVMGVPGSMLMVH